MAKVKIQLVLPEELVKYMDEDPYVGDYSSFIAMLIRRWQRELEKSRCQEEEPKNSLS